MWSWRQGWRQLELRSRRDLTSGVLTSGDAQFSDRTVSPLESSDVESLVPFAMLKYLSRSNLREEGLIWGS